LARFGVLISPLAYVFGALAAIKPVFVSWTLIAVAAFVGGVGLLFLRPWARKLIMLVSWSSAVFALGVGLWSAYGEILDLDKPGDAIDVPLVLSWLVPCSVSAYIALRPRKPASVAAENGE